MNIRTDLSKSPHWRPQMKENVMSSSLIITIAVETLSAADAMYANEETEEHAPLDIVASLNRSSSS